MRVVWAGLDRYPSVFAVPRTHWSSPFALWYKVQLLHGFVLLLWKSVVQFWLWKLPYVGSCYTGKNSIPASNVIFRRKVSYRKCFILTNKRLMTKRMLNALLALAEKWGYLNTSLHACFLPQHVPRNLIIIDYHLIWRGIIHQQENAMCTKAWCCALIGSLQSLYITCFVWCYYT